MPALLSAAFFSWTRPLKFTGVVVWSVFHPLYDDEAEMWHSVNIKTISKSRKSFGSQQRHPHLLAEGYLCLDTPQTLSPSWPFSFSFGFNFQKSYPTRFQSWERFLPGFLFWSPTAVIPPRIELSYELQDALLSIGWGRISFRIDDKCTTYLEHEGRSALPHSISKHTVLSSSPEGSNIPHHAYLDLSCRSSSTFPHKVTLRVALAGAPTVWFSS